MGGGVKVVEGGVVKVAKEGDLPQGGVVEVVEGGDPS